MKKEALEASRARREALKAAFKPHMARAGVTALLDSCIDDDDCTVDMANAKLLACLSVQDEGTQGVSPNVVDIKASNAKPRAHLAQVLQAKMGAKVDIDQNNPTNTWEPWKRFAPV